MELQESVKTKDKILHTAIELFAAKGFGDVSMREIAAAVGIRASSLYKHYESKNEILECIFQLFRSSMDAANVPETDLKDYLKTVTPEEFLNQSFSLFKETMWTPGMLKVARIITTEQQRNGSVKEFFLEELIRKPNEMLRQVLDGMIENGSIQQMDTKAAAEEYNAYIIYLYFEQNYLKESPCITEIEQKMRRHNAFFANYVLNGRKAVQ